MDKFLLLFHLVGKVFPATPSWTYLHLMGKTFLTGLPSRGKVLLLLDLSCSSNCLVFWVPTMDFFLGIFNRTFRWCIAPRTHYKANIISSGRNVVRPTMKDSFVTLKPTVSFWTVCGTSVFIEQFYYLIWSMAAIPTVAIWSAFNYYL